MYCKHCGKQIENDVAYCSFCGGAQKVISKDEAVGLEPESPIIANDKIEATTTIATNELQQGKAGFWWAWWKGMLAFVVGLAVNFISAFPIPDSLEKVLSLVGSVVACIFGVVALFDGRKGRLLGILGIIFVIVFFQSSRMV